MNNTGNNSFAIGLWLLTFLQKNYIRCKDIMTTLERLSLFNLPLEDPKV